MNAETGASGESQSEAILLSYEGLASAIRRLKNGLDEELNSLQAKRPSITDDITELWSAAVGASELKGQRIMLEKVVAELGLTEDTLDATIE